MYNLTGIQTQTTGGSLKVCDWHLYNTHTVVYRCKHFTNSVFSNVCIKVPDIFHKMPLDSAWSILTSSFYCLCMGPPRKKKDKNFIVRSSESRYLLNEDYNTSTNTVDVLFEGIHKFHDDQRQETDTAIATSSGSLPLTEETSLGVDNKLHSRSKYGATSGDYRQVNSKNSYNHIRESAIDDVAQQIIRENRATRSNFFQDGDEYQNLLPSFDEGHNLFYTAEDILEQRNVQDKKSNTFGAYIWQFLDYLSTTGLELVSGKRRTGQYTSTMLNAFDAPLELEFHRHIPRDEELYDETNISSSFSRNSFHTINSAYSMSTQRIIFSDNHSSASQIHEGDATLLTLEEAEANAVSN